MNHAGVGSRIAVEPRKPLCDDCWSLLSKWRPRVLGEQQKCTVCDNKMVVVTANELPMEFRGNFSEMVSSRAEKTQGDFVLYTVALEKARFRWQDKADDWVKTKGYFAEKTIDGKTFWMYRQAPADWMKPGFLKVMRIENGVLALVGLRKAEFAGRKLTEADVKTGLTKGVDQSGRDLLVEKAGFVAFAPKPRTAGAPVAPGQPKSVPVKADGSCPAGFERRGEACVEMGAAKEHAPVPSASAAPAMTEIEMNVVTWLDTLVDSIEAGTVRGGAIMTALKEIEQKLMPMAAPVPGPAEDTKTKKDLPAELEARTKGFHARLTEVLGTA